MPLEKSLYLITQNEKEKGLNKRWVSGEERTFHPGRGSLTPPESTSLLPRDSKTNIWRVVMWLPTSQLWPMPTAPPPTQCVGHIHQNHFVILVLRPLTQTDVSPLQPGRTQQAKNLSSTSSGQQHILFGQTIAKGQGLGNKDENRHFYLQGPHCLWGIFQFAPRRVYAWSKGKLTQEFKTWQSSLRKDLQRVWSHWPPSFDWHCSFPHLRTQWALNRGSGRTSSPPKCRLISNSLTQIFGNLSSKVTLVHFQSLAIKYRLSYGVLGLKQIHTGLH